MFPGIVPKASPEIERVIAVVSSEPVWLIWLARAHRPVGRPRQPGRPTGRPTWLAVCNYMYWQTLADIVMLAFVPEGSRDGSSLYSTITKTFFIDKKNAGNDNILTHSLFSRALGDFHILYGSTFGRGAFTNYVDKILPIIDHLPAPFDIGEELCSSLHC